MICKSRTIIQQHGSTLPLPLHVPLNTLQQVLHAMLHNRLPFPGCLSELLVHLFPLLLRLLPGHLLLLEQRSLLPPYLLLFLLLLLELVSQSLQMRQRLRLTTFPRLLPMLFLLTTFLCFGCSRLPFPSWRLGFLFLTLSLWILARNLQACDKKDTAQNQLNHH